MADIENSLKRAMAISGSIAACLVDYDSGMALGTAGGGGLDLEVAAAGNTDVVKAKLRTMESLGLNEQIEDLLITLDTQFHLLRPVHSKWGRGLFLYLALNRSQANLAMARRELAIIEAELEL
ncbi:MAG: hypothetical protein AAGA99_28005 [Actinomycetota bacterium]